jgi:hypothetical protein
MKPITGLPIFAMVLVANAAGQQPQIAANGVLNATSNALAGPIPSIALGSIFSTYGTNLGPSSSPALSYRAAHS